MKWKSKKKKRREKVIRAKKVARLYDVSLTTIWRWERAGLIPAKRKYGPNVTGWLRTEIEEHIAKDRSKQ